MGARAQKKLKKKMMKEMHNREGIGVTQRKKLKVKSPENCWLKMLCCFNVILLVLIRDICGSVVLSFWMTVYISALIQFNYG